MEAKKVFSRTGIGLIIIIIMGVIVSGIGAAIIPEAKITESITLTMMYIGFYILGLPILLLLLRKAPHIEVESKVKFSVIKLLKLCIIGIAGMYLINMIYSGIMFIFTETDGNAVSELLSNMNIYSVAILVVIVAPVMEELLFRKILYKFFGVYGKKFFIISSAFIFGLFHMNLGQALYASLLGLILGWVYVESGKIWNVIFMHIFINAIGSLFPMIVMSSENEIATVIFGLWFLFVIISGIIMSINMIKKYKKPENLLISDEIEEPKKIIELFKSKGMMVYIVVCVLMIIMSFSV
jgi:CAAX amino terminal protease family.